jgi:glycosyltransferase involved in cell wall biosynthesis
MYIMPAPGLLCLILVFLLTSTCPAGLYAQELTLPKPGTRVQLSAAYQPPTLKGIKVHPQNPFRLDFILDQGEGANDLKEDSGKLVKYFLASLTTPDEDLWVNLSPYEKDRIVPESLGQTDMGRDLLGQDYLLKQVTASLIYPDDETGKRFWKRVYEESARKFGTTNIPVNTFNKVWIVPDKAVVYENAAAGTAYVVESRLKVMLEADYLADFKNQSQANDIGKTIVREIVLPQLTKEINEGRNFAQLRQVYSSLILAAWYKKKIKESILSQVYTDKNKVAGIVSLEGRGAAEEIYQKYLQSFKKGAYNFIKEERDPVTQHPVSRKYFSGGAALMKISLDYAMGASVPARFSSAIFRLQIDLQSLPQLSFQDRRPSDSGLLNGRTILRFSDSMNLSGGLGSYIDELDRELLKRNNVTILRLFYSPNPNLGRRETKIGKGTLIEVPIFFDRKRQGGKEELVKSSLIRFIRGIRAEAVIRYILGLEKLAPIFKIFPVTRRYYVPAPYLLETLRQKLDDILGERNVDMLINHVPYQHNETRIIIEEAARHNVPIAIQNHGTNDLFKNMLALPENPAIKSIATVTSLDIPDKLRAKTTTLWDGIDTEFFSPDPLKINEQELSALKTRFAISDSDQVILLPARVVERVKGHEDLIKIAALLKKKGVAFKVIFAGEEQAPMRYIEKLKATIARLGLKDNFTFTGNLNKEQLKLMYFLSEVIVLPSASEGTGRVLLEAEAMGKPVIAYDNSGMREALVNARTGYLVPDRNYEQFADRLSRLLRNRAEAQRMGLHGRDFVVKKYSLPALALRHERFYLNLLSSNQAARPIENAKQAVQGQETSTGGIDFDTAKLDLETGRQGDEIKFQTDPAMLKQLQEAPGFMPVIISIQPLADVRLFLGLQGKSQSLQTAKL